MPALQNIEFGIDCDSRVALVGPNGAGAAHALLLTLTLDNLACHRAFQNLPACCMRMGCLPNPTLAVLEALLLLPRLPPPPPWHVGWEQHR